MVVRFLWHGGFGYDIFLDINNFFFSFMLRDIKNLGQSVIAISSLNGLDQDLR